MTARHAPGSSGTTTTLALPGLAVMTAPRDGVTKVDRSTQLHEIWDHGPIVALRAEFLGALPSNKKMTIKGMWSPMREGREVGELRRKGRKEHLQRQQTKSASPDIFKGKPTGKRERE